jgi:uncharacterized membrane protein HdeD (DUF308 family)
MSQLTSSQVAVHGNRWKWFLAFGTILLVLGIAGIGVATFMELTSLLVFGPMLLAAAGIQLMFAFFAEKKEESIRRFAASGLEAGLGFWIMAHPLEQIIDLIALIAIFFLVSGLIRIGRLLTTRSPDSGSTVMAGIVALILGICVWLRWPDSRWWFIGLCIAIDILLHGISFSALALAEKKRAQVTVS